MFGVERITSTFEGHAAHAATKKYLNKRSNSRKKNQKLVGMRRKTIFELEPIPSHSTNYSVKN